VLHGLADSMTVHFPWASLLRGVLGHDDAVLAGLAQMLAPGAEATALVSVLPRDGVPAVPAAGALARDFARHGLELAALRPATAAEIAASGSSWAKRLRAGRERPVTLLRFRRVTVDR
jgi:16S rRNA (adenine(1408)-N(1))-methyltransferase